MISCSICDLTDRCVPSLRQTVAAGRQILLKQKDKRELLNIFPTIYMEYLWNFSSFAKPQAKKKKNHGPQDKHLLEELLKCVWKTRFTTGRRVLFESVPEKKKFTHEWVYLSEAETLRLFAVDQSPSHTFHTGLWDRTSAGALGVFLRSPLNRPPLSCRKRRKQRHNQRHNQTQISSFYKERKSE